MRHVRSGILCAALADSRSRPVGCRNRAPSLATPSLIAPRISMSTYRLDKILSPRSIALVGASPREGSLGRIVLNNLRKAGYEGRLDLVNPRHPQIDGIVAAASIAQLEHTPDLIVVTAPARTVPQIIAESAARGVPAAVILTAGLGHGPGSLAESARDAARPHGMRLIGPNCLGVLVPGAKLNASFAATMPQNGTLALASQSGAVAAGMVAWAAKRSVGFSAMVSLGDKIDVDFGDLLDYFALDHATRAILLYIESVSDARKFMSAARAAARVKPVIVIKAGRHAQGAKAAATHTGALAGADDVYDAAFRRAGLLRVFDLDELFAAAETVGRLRPFRGNRLAILTNGGGIGVLAVDRLVDLGGTLASMSEETIKRLDAILPPTWSRSNPVDIIGDAPARRYADALEVLLDDPDSDAVLVMNVPTALASADDAAAAVMSVTQQYRARAFPPKPLLAVWVGDDGPTSESFGAAGIPHFTNEADAVSGFMHLVRYRVALDHLMDTPPSLPEDFEPDTAAARRIIDRALADGRAWLDPIEVARLLEAYRIPITPAVLAKNEEESVAAAESFLARGESVVVKILSPDIVHKSDVGGVRLNLNSAHAVREATADILARVRAAKPQARLTGVTIHPMISRPKARELIAGIADDPTFGPVIVFGCGGTAVEVINDKALALPPLDMKLARDLIARTRISRILAAYRDVPAADQQGVALVLVKLAQLAADLPEIRELDLNPLLADAKGVIAIDARVAIAPVTDTMHRAAGYPRLAIRPYPKNWERRATLRDGTAIVIRPVRPEDEDMVRAFFAAVTPEDLQLRFFAPIKEFGHTFIARLTQLDYARSIAFLAIDERTGAMLGSVRLHADANYDTAEYAVLVRSDLKGRGIGWTLMQLAIEYARSEGIREIEGQVLQQNTTMLAMCRELGFSVAPDHHSSDIRNVRLSL